MARQLRKIYYDPLHPSSFVGKQRLITETQKNIDPDLADSWLNKQTAYNKHKQNVKKFSHRPYTVSNIDDFWECDLIDMKFLKTYNDDYTYLLCVIDVFSKYAWVEPMKTKSAHATIQALRNILKRSDPRVPVCLQSDRGKEFVNSDFQDFLNKKGIKQRLVRNPDVKAAVVERFNRTLKSRMWRYFTFSKSKRYIDILQNLVESYNRAYHSTIKTTPAAVTIDNAESVRTHLKKKISSFKKKSNKYKVNELVRISNKKDVFHKGYTSGWTSEVFVVTRIHDQRFPIVYSLSDLNGEEVDGIFYTEELSSIGLQKPKKLQVNKVLETRGRGQSKRILVTWKTLPSEVVSWIPDTAKK